MRRVRKEEEDGRMSNTPVKAAEHWQLNLPSACQARECSARMRSAEEKLRRGQCSDALKDLRARIIARRWLTTDRNESQVGQGAMTRSQSMLATIARRIREAVRDYRTGREALVALVGVEAAKPYAELLDDHVKEYWVEEDDAEAIRILGRGTAREPRSSSARTSRTRAARDEGQKRRAKRGHGPPGETTSLLSWIWIGDGVPNQDDEAFQRACE